VELNITVKVGTEGSNVRYGGGDTILDATISVPDGISMFAINAITAKIVGEMLDGISVAAGDVLEQSKKVPQFTYTTAATP
jgi:hypothetical protein